MTDHDAIQQIPTPSEALARLAHLDQQLTRVAAHLTTAAKDLAATGAAWKRHRARALLTATGKSAEQREAEVLADETGGDLWEKYYIASVAMDAVRTRATLVRSQVDAARSVLSSV